MRIARVYFDTDLRMSFDGLREILRKEKMTPESLGKGSLIIFLNRKTTAFKLLAGNDYLVYYKNGARKIPLEAIQHLPTYFDGSSLEFSKAIEKTIRKKFSVKSAVLAAVG